jgi:hypothetical protein
VARQGKTQGEVRATVHYKNQLGAHTTPNRLSTVSGDKMNPFGAKVISHQFSVVSSGGAALDSY